MKTISRIFSLYAVLLLILISNNLEAKAIPDEKLSLDIYNIDLNSINNFNTIKKGTPLDFVLLNDTTSEKKQNKGPVNFKIYNNDNLNLKASGFITMSSDSKRFSMSGSLEFSLNKIVLDDGLGIYISADSPLFQSSYPPHANTNSLGLAKAITSLAIASSPATFGASLGISFLASGLLSAYQNGISDFFWAGLDGSGFSFLERIFRKQPELFLPQGILIPFKLREDLKISQGIQKEKMEYINLNKTEAENKIEQLFKWGDLAGALELAVKTGNKEIYENIIRKISS